MNRAIVGSRNYPDPVQVALYVMSLPSDTVVVSGGAPGVDSWAAWVAWTIGLPDPLVFKADWIRYGLAAGPIRNAQVVAACHELTAFQFNNSKGTADAIRKAIKAGKDVEVHQPALESRTVNAR